jgi:hypothetical protein
MTFHNKLERLSLASLSIAYPRVEHLKGTSLRYSPALPANIGLGWKGLPGKNALAYHEKS